MNLKARIGRLEALPGAAGYTRAEDAPDSVLIQIISSSSDLSDEERRVCSKLKANPSEASLSEVEFAVWDNLLKRLCDKSG